MQVWETALWTSFPQVGALQGATWDSCSVQTTRMLLVPGLKTKLGLKSGRCSPRLLSQCAGTERGGDLGECLPYLSLFPTRQDCSPLFAISISGRVKQIFVCVSSEVTHRPLRLKGVGGIRFPIAVYSLFLPLLGWEYFYLCISRMPRSKEAEKSIYSGQCDGMGIRPETVSSPELWLCHQGLQNLHGGPDLCAVQAFLVPCEPLSLAVLTPNVVHLELSYGLCFILNLNPKLFC